ncbi:2629_t:CDS:2 [Diversispora eburnea]|uniref:2629_t:CDS:1 n=1 Tax=Diversispora eburnea TaxID=1213867 RepID=A0A9N8WEJ2_9GLOM|nr:2629_t:CDS:2 [Diversispora eburnea]
MTQKNSKERKQYWIPDNYIVETEMGKRKLRCEMKYGKLHQCQLEISNKSITSRKRPLSLIQSKSGQSKRFTAFGKDSE